jgi:aryl-alcohol dehydrogenase-like predicted oxidoreductase
MSNSHDPAKRADSIERNAVPRIRLGRTGLSVPRIAFGAGPVSGLMTGSDEALQQEVVEAALRCGITWFDTAAGYGNGTSESNLGRVLEQCRDITNAPIHVATKVRIDFSSSQPVDEQIRRSIDSSLQRLRRDQFTLLQLHNGVTQDRGDEPSSISRNDVLGRHGVCQVLKTLQEQGVTQFLGLTGTGHPESLRAVIRSGEFDTIQLPYNMLNPSAGCVMTEEFQERNYGNILADCKELDLGVFAIRVLAGGAILSQAPSAHTLKTLYFPLDLYQRDLKRAEKFQREHSGGSVVSRSIDFALAHDAIHSAIIGFGAPEHVFQAAAALRQPEI